MWCCHYFESFECTQLFRPNSLRLFFIISVLVHVFRYFFLTIYLPNNILSTSINNDKFYGGTREKKTRRLNRDGVCRLSDLSVVHISLNLCLKEADWSEDGAHIRCSRTKSHRLVVIAYNNRLIHIDTHSVNHCLVFVCVAFESLILLEK